MTNLDRILADAMKLTDEERLELADRLVKAVPIDPDIEKAWLEEVERRFAEEDAGKTESIPWDEARRQIFAD